MDRWTNKWTEWVPERLDSWIPTNIDLSCLLFRLKLTTLVVMEPVYGKLYGAWRNGLTHFRNLKKTSEGNHQLEPIWF